MLIERIYDDDLAQASYVIGCERSKEAIVVDPRRDIAEYQSLASARGMKIVAVTETHIHADFLSGTRELAAATGATVYLSGEGGPDWQYKFDGERLYDGDKVTIGRITLQALHTPGHTPEHLSYLVTDGAFSDQPGYLLSGDFVFSGDIGRPDLLAETAGLEDAGSKAAGTQPAGTDVVGARQMFASLRDKFLTLPDYIQVHPGHGAGSVCGKAIGSVPSSTVGYERLYAWWGRHLANNDEEGFVKELLAGQPDAPSYFGRMKRQNLQGPAILGERPPLEELDAETVSRQLAADAVTFVDTRHNAKVHEGTVAGALNIPAGKNFASYAAWAVDPERDPRPLVLLASGREQAEGMRDHLVRVGIDSVAGYVTAIEGLPLSTPRLIRPEDLPALTTAVLLDVRTKSEHADGHIPGSQHLHGGRVLWNLVKLARDRTIVAYCRSGARSSVAASVLRREGYDVVELEGSYAAWAARQGSASASQATA
ncbi:MBL fold metallo-hydrolase [Arthrobacter rhizosphaerae]|uniref:MBL fold metallo-hydrolase n=1 Tax=Arthrobacter rhizosphaerae TaxID=2855490 RepID=UPI001FF16B79|nr:MBL fold metallo-hydrolase [Arthrobacter rhizosphaerae]